MEVNAETKICFDVLLRNSINEIKSGIRGESLMTSLQLVCLCVWEKRKDKLHLWTICNFYKLILTS